MFKYSTIVQLHDTDAAGLLFFANQFKMAHDCYQALLESGNLGFRRVFTELDYLLPIVHAEADFKTTLQVGEALTVEVRSERIGNSSFTLAYSLKDGDGIEVGTAQTVHVCISKKTRESMPLPDDLRNFLSQHQ